MSIGEKIGQYIIDSELGGGAMGVVYRAHDTAMFDRAVAIKILAEKLADTEIALSRFRLEVEVAAKLTHPNIVTIFDQGVHRGRPYFVMEYLEGFGLDHLIRNPETRTHEEKLRIAIQICDALDHAHRQGVVHRDLKPANVMITQRAGRDEAKLVDFGIVHVEDSGLTRDGAQPGTFSYMAPEQIAAGPTAVVDARSDLFSLGIVLCELFCGNHPFRGHSDVITANRILAGDRDKLRMEPGPDSAELEPTLLRLLEHDPKRRLADAAEATAALQAIHVRLQAGSTDPLASGRLAARREAPKEPRPEPTPHRRRSRTAPRGVETAGTRPVADRDAAPPLLHRRSIQLAILAAFVVILAGAGFWLFSSRTPEPTPSDVAAVDRHAVPSPAPERRLPDPPEDPTPPISSQTRDEPAEATPEPAPPAAPNPTPPEPKKDKPRIEPAQAEAVAPPPVAPPTLEVEAEPSPAPAETKIVEPDPAPPVIVPVDPTPTPPPETIPEPEPEPAAPEPTPRSEAELWSDANRLRENRAYDSLALVLDELLTRNPGHRDAAEFLEKLPRWSAKQSAEMRDVLEEMLEDFAAYIDDREINNIEDQFAGLLDTSTRSYFDGLFHNYEGKIRSFPGLFRLDIVDGEADFVAEMRITAKRKKGQEMETVGEYSWSARLVRHRGDYLFEGSFP